MRVAPFPPGKEENMPEQKPIPGTEGQIEDLPKTRGGNFGGGPSSSDDKLVEKGKTAQKGQLGNADPSVPGPFRQDDRKAS
jgi:hypothetical protein